MNTAWVGSDRVETIHCGFCVIFERASNRKNDKLHAVLHIFIKSIYWEFDAMKLHSAALTHSHNANHHYICVLRAVRTKRAINPYAAVNAFECTWSHANYLGFRKWHILVWNIHSQAHHSYSIELCRSMTCRSELCLSSCSLSLLSTTWKTR